MQGQNLINFGELLEAEQILTEAISLAEEHDFDGFFVQVTTQLASCYALMERHGDKIHQYEIVAANPLNMGSFEFWTAAGEIALHYAKAGNSEVANRYISAISDGPANFVTPAIKAQSEEAQYWLLLGQGQKVKAKNMANKAMVNYLLDSRTDDATRLAQVLRELD